jgi:hypothetical protein
MENFEIRTYGRTELALCYFPDLNPQVAYRKLQYWIDYYPHLREELECRNTFPELAGGSCVQSSGHAQGGPTGGEGAESRKDQCGSYRRGEGTGKRRTGLTELLYDGGKTRR